MKLSIVTSLYRSAPFVEEFYQRAVAAGARLADDVEIVLVNDGSPDDALKVAVGLHEQDPRVRVVDLSRNFGQHPAMLTGLRHATGDLVYLLDCDLEERPEWLGPFHEAMRKESADVVFGVQPVRKGGWFERASGELFFWCFNAIAALPIPRNLITARLMTRRYVDALLSYPEREVFMAGMWASTGFKQHPVEVQKGSKGHSSYSLVKKLRHVVNAVTSFSNRPLLFVFYLGIVISLTAGLAAVYLIVRRLFFGELLAGWPSLIVSIWLLGGINIFCVGIVGVYLARVYMETKQRPLTIVRHVYERTEDSSGESRDHQAERRDVLHVET